MRDLCAFFTKLLLLWLWDVNHPKTVYSAPLGRNWLKNAVLAHYAPYRGMPGFISLCFRVPLDDFVDIRKMTLATEVLKRVDNDIFPCLRHTGHLVIDPCHFWIAFEDIL